MVNPVTLPDQLNPHGFKHLIDLFEHRQHTSAGLAFSYWGQDLDFKSFTAQVYALAAYLQQLPDVRAGDRIAIQLPSSNHYPVVVWAAICSGLIIVNTNPLYTEPELVKQYKDAEPKILVSLTELMPLMSKICAELDIPIVIGVDINPSEQNKSPTKIPQGVIRFSECIDKGMSLKYTMRKAPSLDDTVALQYTGGTTGTPKGAILSHGNLLAHIGQINHSAKELDLTPNKDTIVQPLPLYHVFGFSMSCLFSVANSLHTVLIPDPRDIDDLIKTLKRYPPALFVGINSLYAALLAHPEVSSLDFSRVKRFISGGSALTQNIAKRWYALCGQEIYEGYGLTEVSCTLSANTQTKHRAGTVGLPLLCSEAKCINDLGETLPPNTAGELCARGPQIMQGYWRKPEESATCLSKDGWLRTGDIALIEDDGMLRIVDRKKDMVLVSGFNVYPNEIEDVATQHPQILEAGAIAVKDEKTGEAVKLFVVSNDDSLTAEELRAFCKERLAGYKVPKIIEFRKTLPKSPVGKILRRQLR